MLKFVYAERLALYLLDILFTWLQCEEKKKKNELRLSAITNPTPVYLEQLSPTPAYTLALVCNPASPKFYYYNGISAQSVKHSIVKHSNVESSSFSLVAASGKSERQFAGSTEIEDVAMDFLFY